MPINWQMLDALDALLKKDGVSDDTKVLIQAFRDHAKDVEDRLKELEKLTQPMRAKAMLN